MTFDDTSTSGLYPQSLLLRFGFSIAVGFAATVVTAIAAGFLSWFVADLVVNEASGFASAGPIVLRIAVVAGFAAGAGLGAFAFCVTSPHREVDDEPSPTEAVAAGAALLLLVAMGLASGVGVVIVIAAPFVLFGGLLGSRRVEARNSSAPQPGPYEMAEAA